MPGRAAIIAALTEYANKPATSHDILAEPADAFGRPPLATLMQFTQAIGSRAELDALLAEVAPMIRAELFRGSEIALNCGTMVEWGGDPGVVFPHLLAELPRHLSLARRARERNASTPGTLFDEDPDGARATAGLRYLLLATMTVVCRKTNYRRALRGNAEIVAGVASLRDTSAEADFLAQVLALSDGVELLVLVPEEPKGFRVALEAVQTNAHLFTLLQASLIGGGYLTGEAVDPEVVAIATGETPHQRLVHDHARFHFSTWGGLPSDSIDTLLTTWIPVEGTPTDIPQLDGQRIVVLGPNVMGSQSWDSSFFANIHDALKSRAEVVEVLPEADVNRWLERIRAAR